MSATLRVPTSVFKSNMRPFVDQAKAGKTVIVTNEGKDEFRVFPVEYSGRPPVSEKPIPAKSYKGIDVDEPAFKSWE